MNTFTSYISLFFYWLLLGVIAFNLQAQNTYSADKKIAVKDLKKDFKIVQKALQNGHPGLYTHRPPSAIDSLFDSTLQNLSEPLTENEFYQQLMPLVAQINCAHTRLVPSKAHKSFVKNQQELFPFYLKFTGNNVYIRYNLSRTKSIPVGAKLISINQQPIDEILNTILPNIPSDGLNTSYKYRLLDQGFINYYSNFFGRPKLFEIEYIAPGETDITEAKVKAMFIKNINQNYYDRYISEAKKNQKPLRYERLASSNNTGVLTIETFDTYSIKKADLNYQKFLAATFKQIQKDQISNLIIDLRGNMGGQENSAELLTYLVGEGFKFFHHAEVKTDKKYTFLQHSDLPSNYKINAYDNGDGTFWVKDKNLIKTHTHQAKPNTFKGNVYVLVDGRTLDTAAQFTALAHHLNAATFIGEETGGNYNGFNFHTTLVTLPNSNLRLYFPLIRVKNAVTNYPYADMGLIPDYEVDPKIEDIIEGKDTVKDFTLEMIDSKSDK